MLGLELRGPEVRVGGEAGKLDRIWVACSLKSPGWDFTQSHRFFCLSVCHKNALKIFLDPFKISVQWARGGAWISAFLIGSHKRQF